MIQITRINEFAVFMTGQEWQNARKSFIVRYLQSLHIHYGREFNGAPLSFLPFEIMRYQHTLGPWVWVRLWVPSIQ